MFKKILKFFFIITLFYQSTSYSKSTSLENFNSKDLSNYFSGIVAFENKKTTEALKFFNSSKVLLNQHDPYLKRYITALVLENKVSQAINVVSKNKNKKNIDFFEAYLLLVLDSLKKNNIEKAYTDLKIAFTFAEQGRFNSAILETLNEYIFVFKEKKLLNTKKNFGNLSIITETFQKCYLDDVKTENYFSNLVNKNDADYSRYIYFYLTYLIKKNKFNEIKNLISKFDYLNSTLLLSQGKSWIESGNYEKFQNIFSCQNHNHIISEFLFLISNLYSSEENFEKSNFYLYLSNYLNPKFIYNLSLVVENYFLNGDYMKSKKILYKFKKIDNFYYWFRLKKEAQMIAKQKNQKASLDYIISEFNKIKKPNNKIIFDMADFYKKTKDYKKAIQYYTKVIDNLDDDSNLKSDILYRRGGSHERNGDYINADKDLLQSLSINPNDAYVLNYLAYSWLEREYKIDKAIEMLELAYNSTKDDPYIIDSIGWAYYLIDDYLKAEEFLRRAVELMPDDPIVNDHYGDILWKLNQKIQARYFWKNVLKMKDVEEEMIKNINIKLLEGPKNS